MVLSKEKTDVYRMFFEVEGNEIGGFEENTDFIRFNDTYFTLPNTYTLMLKLYKQFPTPINKEVILKGIDIGSKIDPQGDIKVYDHIFRPHQNEGIRDIEEKKNYCLFGEQRVGKTGPAAYATRLYNKVIVLCPKGLENVGLDAYKKFSPFRTVKILPISPKDRKIVLKEYVDSKEFILIGRVGMMSKQQFLKGDYIILDEAHFLRNANSIQSKQTTLLRSNFKYAIALSGTPAINDAVDAIRLVQGVSGIRIGIHNLAKYFFNPDLSNPYSNFSYTDVKYSKRKEGKEGLFSFSSIKRFNDICLYYSPPKEKEIEFKLTPYQVNSIKSISERYNLLLKSGVRYIYQGDLDAAIAIRQITMSPSLVDPEAPFLSPKIDGLIKFIKKNKRKRIIVWSTSSFLEEIAKMFDHSLLLTGKTTPKERSTIEARFKEKPCVLFSNLAVGSQGYTFDLCDDMIFVDQDYKPHFNKQAKMRLAPTNPDNVRDQTIYYLKYHNSSDTHTQLIIDEKNDKTKILEESHL